MTLTTPGTAYDRFRWAQELLAHRDPNAAYGILAELKTELESERRTGLQRETGAADGSSWVSAVRAELTRAAYHSARLDLAVGLARESLADDPTDVEALVILVRALQRSSRVPEARMALRRLEALAGPDAQILTDLKERMR